MKIKSIQYPPGCQPKGWRKMVFERRLKLILGFFFNVCELDQCRAEILGKERDDERYGELSVFHCESFKTMGAAEVHALVERTGQYVGVEIAMGQTSRVPGTLVAIMGGMLIGAAGVWSIPPVKAVKGATSMAHAEQLASVGRLQLATPAARIAESPSEPVFATTVRTNRPGVTARTLARTVRNDAGEYEVSLTVTPMTTKGEQ